MQVGQWHVQPHAVSYWGSVGPAPIGHLPNPHPRWQEVLQVESKDVALVWRAPQGPPFGLPLYSACFWGWGQLGVIGQRLLHPLLELTTQGRAKFLVWCVQDVGVKAPRLVDAPHGVCGDSDVHGLSQDLAAVGLALDVGSPRSLRPARIRDKRGREVYIRSAWILLSILHFLSVYIIYTTDDN